MEDALQHMVKTDHWSEETKGSTATCGSCAKLNAILHKDSVPYQEQRRILMCPEEGFPVPQGKEEFIGKGNTEDVEPIKTKE